MPQIQGLTSANIMPWLQHLPLQCGCCLPLSIKIAGHTNTHTSKELKFIKVNIFIRPEETKL